MKTESEMKGEEPAVSPTSVLKEEVSLSFLVNVYVFRCVLRLF